MVHYEVVVDAEPGVTARFEAYMCEKHIPEILATGCFTEIRLQRGDGGRFRTVYSAESRADLERYLTDHTAAFRADFTAHFPDGVSAAREVWTDLKAWPG